ncbi:hypothetical protein Peur_030645 [Populus x canadensis]
MEKMVSAMRGRWSGRQRQRRYLLVVVEIAMAGSEEDEGAGVVFVYVVMCMAVGNEACGEELVRWWITSGGRLGLVSHGWWRFLHSG